jgi:acid phosphatase family membrane protein YuiD
MSFLDALGNKALIAALLAWGMAQMLKLPIEYISKKEWNWSLLFRAGGMPSSHSALVAALAHGIGLTAGFGTAVFALSVGLAMIVVYDAAGVRRQAGLHAEMINTIIQDLIESRHLPQEKLREVLGHSPLESIVGVLFGIAVAHVVVLMWTA